MQDMHEEAETESVNLQHNCKQNENHNFDNKGTTGNGNKKKRSCLSSPQNLFEFFSTSRMLPMIGKSLSTVVPEHVHRVHRVELRLGVVFYGGVSLAIYSFGHTYEIKNLWDASQAFDSLIRKGKAKDVSELNSAKSKLQGPAKVYFDLISEIYQTRKVHITTIIDLISGTSAGGVNSIILAKSLKTGAPLKGLNNFWLEEADMKKLQGNNRNKFTYSSAITGSMGSIASLFAGSKSDVIASLPRSEYNYAVRAFRSNVPLFDGEQFHKTLASGIAQLNEQAVQGHVPPRKLTVFTTLTDLTAIYNKSTQEKQHSLVLRFEHGGPGHFNELDSNRELAFAARATSSFPVAFPGITAKMGESLKVSGESPVATSSRFLQSQTHRWTADLSPHELDEMANHESVDGGLILNKPFDPVLDELRKKRVASGLNCQRVLLYLDPSPAAIKWDHLPADRVSEVKKDVLFPSANEQDIAQTKMGKKLQQRYKELKEAAMNLTKDVSNSQTYPWLSHLTAVAGASSSQPLVDQFESVDDFNEQVVKVSDYIRRTAIRSLKYLDTYYQSIKNEEALGLWIKSMNVFYGVNTTETEIRSMVDIFDRYFYGTKKLNPWDPNEWEKVLWYCGETLPPPMAKESYAEQRFHDFVSMLTVVLASRSYLFFPEGTDKYRELASKVNDLMKFPVDGFKSPIFKDSKFSTVFRGNIFMCRDRYQVTLRNIENGLKAEDTSSSNVELDDELVAQISRLIYKTIERIDEVYYTPSVELKTSFENWTFKENIAPLLDYWESKSQEIYRETTEQTEAIINTFGTEHPGYDATYVRQLVYRPQVAFSYFDVYGFPVTAPLKLGDHVRTRLVKLSPDSIDVYHKRLPTAPPATALFRNAREAIKTDGNVSFADVFLQSSDLAHFGGFLSRSAREFDLTWGRLDSCEQMCKLLVDTFHGEIEGLGREPIGAEVVAKYSKQAAVAVLEEALKDVVSDKDNVEFYRLMKRKYEDELVLPVQSTFKSTFFKS